VFDPLSVVGLVLAGNENGQAPVGTCFRFRHVDFALTAAHCVPDVDRLYVVFPRLGQAEIVAHVERHPQADIAALTIGPLNATDGYPENAFWDRVSNWSLGEEAFAYGYPVEGPALRDASTPTPRLVVGHYQRFFDYESHNGFRYLAGELSFPAPGGLSGGPVFRQGAPQMLTGMVTSSHESYAITDSVDEINDDGSVLRIEGRKVITYGIALMLSGVSDWLHEVAPDVPGMGWVS
jgi:hypothetical protein